MAKYIKRIVWILVSCFLLIGCSSKQEKEQGVLSTTITPMEDSNLEQTIQNGYVFLYDTIELMIDMPAKDVLEQLGDYKSYFEAPSCAIESTIRTYGYGSFEIDTYELEGIEYISSIFFKDDTITTKEGVFLFMSKEQLFSIYGEDYEEEAGMLVYSKDNMKLKFVISEEVVSSIQYTSLATEVKQ